MLILYNINTVLLTVHPGMLFCTGPLSKRLTVGFFTSCQPHSTTSGRIRKKRLDSGE